MLVAPSSIRGSTGSQTPIGYGAQPDAGRWASNLSVLTNPKGSASSRGNALTRTSGPRQYTDGLARWGVVEGLKPRTGPPKDAPLAKWGGSVNHSTCSSAISGVRVFTRLYVGDRVRLRPAAVPQKPAEGDETATDYLRQRFGATRHCGDSFAEYVAEAGLDQAPNVPKSIDLGTIGMVKFVDLPRRECEVDFAFTQTQKLSESFRVGEPSPRSKARMKWHRVKFEELEVCQTSDDLDAVKEAARVSVKVTQARAKAALREALNTPEVQAQREFQHSRREALEMWQSSLVGKDVLTKKRKKKKKVNLTASANHQLQQRLMESGSSEFAAYFQLQQQYSSARADFAEGVSRGVTGNTKIILAVDESYTEAEITACNVRDFHRKAMAMLNVALRVEDAGTAVPQLEEAKVLLERIQREQPTFLKVRIGLRKCDTRLELMRGALLHSSKVAMGRQMHGDNLEEVSLCEIDQSEEQLKIVFDMIDDDGSGALDEGEVARLIHYFQDKPPTEEEAATAMEFMDRDRSGSIEFDEFLWWWRERTVGEDVVEATSSLQAHFRGVMARREVAQDQFRIVRIQSKIRAKLGRRRFIRLRRERGERQAIADQETMRRGNLAAMKIQSMFRGDQGRRSAKEMREELFFKEMEAASIKIQSSFRGMRGRRQGETKRDYQKRLYNLNKKAMRVWANGSMGAVFTDWVEFVERVRNLRRRSIARMAHAAASAAFETWYEFAEESRVHRAEVLLELGSDLIAQVAGSDPQESFRNAMSGLMENGSQVESVIDAFWDYKRGVMNDMDCGRVWCEARLGHYMGWVESGERMLYAEDVPAAPESMVQPRVQPKKGLLGGLRKEKSQVARGVLLRITATRATGKGAGAYNVTVEPQQSLNVAVEAGQRLLCNLAPDAVTPGALDAVEHLLDRSGTHPATVRSEVSEGVRSLEEAGELEEGELVENALAWGGRGCSATFDIDDTHTMRITGSLSSENGTVEDCMYPDGSHPTRKIGVFTIGLKDVTGWRRGDDADTEGTEVFVTHEWAVVKAAPPACLLRVSLDPTVPLGGENGPSNGDTDWGTGTLSVEVVRVEGLAPGGGGWDKADPYAQVNLHPAVWRGREQMRVQPEPQELRTTALDNTLSPVWEETVDFVENIGMAPSPDMALFYTTEEADETSQCSLRELRGLIVERSLPNNASVWWPALGKDLLGEDGDGDEVELNWISLEAADGELGLLLGKDHGLAGASLEVVVMDKDMLSKDDVVAEFPPLPLSVVRPLGRSKLALRACVQDFWLEAGVAVRPPRVDKKAQAREPDAETLAREGVAREAFDRCDLSGNGLLERDEILALLESMANVGSQRSLIASLGEVPDIETMMVQLDTDGSGEVGFDQFYSWYEEHVAKKEGGDDISMLFRLSRSLG